MQTSGELVSVGLPVRNGADRLERVVKSVLAQDHERLELVITDNASTDGTEELCRTLAAGDSRIRYHRQPRNVGLLNNFISAIRLARGDVHRWIGDDDWLAPTAVSRALECFAADPRLLVVTTGMSYTATDTERTAETYTGSALASDDPVARLTEIVRLINAGRMVVDPLYGFMRREPVLAIERRNMLREDEIFAIKLAVAGPWGHVPEVLGVRHRTHDRLPAIARRLDVPVWQAYASNVLQLRELHRWIATAGLDRHQRLLARLAFLGMYGQRHGLAARHRMRRIRELAANGSAHTPGKDAL